MEAFEYFLNTTKWSRKNWRGIYGISYENSQLQLIYTVGIGTMRDELFWNTFFEIALRNEGLRFNFEMLVLSDKSKTAVRKRHVHLPDEPHAILGKRIKEKLKLP